MEPYDFLVSTSSSCSEMITNMRVVDDMMGTSKEMGLLIQYYRQLQAALYSKELFEDMTCEMILKS